MKRLVASIIILTLAACGGSANPPLPGGQASANTNPGRPNAANTEFYAQGRTLMFKGNGAAKAFYIKGVDYGPTPICAGPLETPLGDANRAIWSRDLPILRDLGVNAIKVYNSAPNADLSAFLNAAYNGGNKPIYVILSIFFNSDKPLDPGAVQALKGQYETLAQKNGSFPALMGISIGSEINSDKFINDPKWWGGLNTIASGARSGFQKVGARKILTTSLVDDGLNTVREGERFKYDIDAWGINVYRGASWTSLWSEAKAATTKPFLLGEWGAPVSYHPNGNPNQAQEWPTAQIGVLKAYFTGLEKAMYAEAALSGGVSSGGFLFEYTDEWWKADPNNSRGGFCKQLPNGVKNGNFPGGFNDEAWYGLNSLDRGEPNVLEQRPVFGAMKRTWASEPD
jgi:hypothetical protein